MPHVKSAYYFGHVVHVCTRITIHKNTMSILSSKDAMRPFASGLYPSAALTPPKLLPSTTNLSLQTSTYF